MGEYRDFGSEGVLLKLLASWQTKLWEESSTRPGTAEYIFVWGRAGGLKLMSAGGLNLKQK